MRRQTLRYAASAIALGILLMGCAVAPPPPLSEDASLRPPAIPLDFHLVIATVTSAYPALPIRDDAPALSEAKDEAIAGFAPAMDQSQIGALTATLSEALGLISSHPVQTISREAGGAAQGPELGAPEQTRPLGQGSAGIFAEAEDRGAQLVVSATLSANRLAYLGHHPVATIADLSVLTGAPPWHWFIPDERFSLRREIVLQVHDVRSPGRPLYETVLRGEASMVLNEFEHGIILFNPFRVFMDERAERYRSTNWRRVYEALAPHADRALQRALVADFRNGLLPLLRAPELRERLRRGDPSKARLYALLIGADRGSVRHAADDARALAVALKRAGLSSARVQLITGEVGRKDIEQGLARLASVKAVDRVLVFFAGQGQQTAKGQSLRLHGEERFALAELAEGFKAIPSEHVAFVLDSSFGDARRQSPGARSTADSLPKAADPGAYLAPLAQGRRGWQVLCAADHDQISGEYRGQGLLTGMILDQLRSGEQDLGRITQAIGARYARRSHALLGGSHRPVLLPAEGRAPFALLP